MNAGTSSAGSRAILGGVAWVFVTWWSVHDLRSFQWSSSLLLFAALVIVPLVLELVREFSGEQIDEKFLAVAQWIQFPAAVLLMLSSAQPQGWLALGLAAPWIGLTALLAVAGVVRICRRGLLPHWKLCRDVGLGFMAVGGAWVLADRVGMHPLGFSSDIVQLTAVHFHFAGLILPVVTGLVLREFPQSRITGVAGWGVLAGVPLVAVGITSTQLGGGHVMELISALVLGLSAMVIAIMQLRLARQSRGGRVVRGLWTIAGFSLFFAMTLALLYAMRTYVAPLPWLDIPWMRALHGTANALGFAFCAALGWQVASWRQPTRAQIEKKKGSR